MSYERSPRLVCSITTGIIHSSPFIHYNRHHLTSFIRLIREASSPSILYKSYYIPLVNKGQIFTFLKMDWKCAYLVPNKRSPASPKPGTI